MEATSQGWPLTSFQFPFTGGYKLYGTSEDDPKVFSKKSQGVKNFADLQTSNLNQTTIST
jgi:hypothetical protein